MAKSGAMDFIGVWAEYNRFSFFLICIKNNNLYPGCKLIKYNILIILSRIFLFFQLLPEIQHRFLISAHNCR